MFLSSETIFRYLISDDEETDTLILCKSSEIELITTDLNLHEAIESIDKSDDFRLNKLGKFFEVVKVVSYENINHSKKPILTDKRVEKIRSSLGGENGKEN